MIQEKFELVADLLNKALDPLRSDIPQLASLSTYQKG
jgi:hypothetical protein